MGDPGDPAECAGVILAPPGRVWLMGVNTGELGGMGLVATGLVIGRCGEGEEFDGDDTVPCGLVREWEMRVGGKWSPATEGGGTRGPPKPLRAKGGNAA